MAGSMANTIGKLWATGPAVGATVRNEDGKLLQDVTSFNPGDVNFGTAEYGGAGLLGTMEIPATGQLESAELTLNVKGKSEQHGDLSRPGKHKFELSAVQDVLEVGSDKVIEHRGVKAYVTCILKSHTSGDVEVPNTIDDAFTYEILRYEEYVSGAEVIFWDKLNWSLRVNGVETMDDIASML